MELLSQVGCCRSLQGTAVMTAVIAAVITAVITAEATLLKFARSLEAATAADLA